MVGGEEHLWQIKDDLGEGLFSLFSTPHGFVIPGLGTQEDGMLYVSLSEKT